MADLIADIGMHDGQDTDFYLKKGYRVVAVEANPELVEAGRQRFTHEIESGRLTIIHAAIGASAGPVKLFVNDRKTDWSSIHEHIAGRVEGGFLDFDVAIATPDMMGKIGRLGRVLGRRGLMPNPRTNTVVQPQDIPASIAEAKKGRVELRMDRTAVIHSPVGKTSFADEQLIANIASVVDTINRLRPSAVKGQFVKTAHMATTMGPSVPLDVGATMAMKVE